MLADILMLQSAASGFVATLVLAISSTTGVPLVVGVLLLAWAFSCAAFLFVNWRLAVRARHRRAAMLEMARDHGFAGFGA